MNATRETTWHSLLRSMSYKFTWSVFVDFVRRPRHVHIFGPTPETLVQTEVTHLSVELVVANVTLDEVLRGPAYRA